MEELQEDIEKRKMGKTKAKKDRKGNQLSRAGKHAYNKQSKKITEEEWKTTEARVRTTLPAMKQLEDEFSRRAGIYRNLKKIQMTAESTSTELNKLWKAADMIQTQREPYNNRAPHMTGGGGKPQKKKPKHTNWWTGLKWLETEDIYAMMEHLEFREEIPLTSKEYLFKEIENLAVRESTLSQHSKSTHHYGRNRQPLDTSKI